MKVIGKINSESYICEVSHTEIEKFKNLYYNKLHTLKVGDSLDLGAGYDFYVDTVRALNKTEELISSNKKVVEAILNGITLVGSNKGE